LTLRIIHQRYTTVLTLLSKQYLFVRREYVYFYMPNRFINVIGHDYSSQTAAWTMVELSCPFALRNKGGACNFHLYVGRIRHRWESIKQVPAFKKKENFMNNITVLKGRLILLCLFSIMLVACTGGEQPSGISGAADGELAARIKMIENRFVHGTEPAISEDFLIAGLTLDPEFQRRFTNYSGDQCGRYLSAFSDHRVRENPVNIQHLVQRIITTQRDDGRFGSRQLDFSRGRLRGDHMALLWGNGRLLNGLLDYYQASQDPLVLAAAVKLGDFLIRSADFCMRPDVIEEFKSKGAMGFICVTQNIEGIVKLYQATGEQKYLDDAAKIYPLLPAMGRQHTHGYLITLRGVLMLYGVTKLPEQLDFVESRYRQIIDSDSYLLIGGVPEYFLESGSKGRYRDEGCSQADWLMLSLGLWEATGEKYYLDKAEYCLVNAMMANQFDSGDFGHHLIESGFGYVSPRSEGRAWWCCDYHGLQALLKVRDKIVTKEKGEIKINLFYPADYKDEQIKFTFRRVDRQLPVYQLTVESAASDEIVIAVRKPSWLDQAGINVNGRPVEAEEKNGYLLVSRTWQAGDRLNLILHYQLQVLSGADQRMALDSVPQKQTGTALQYGPYLLCADDRLMPAFMAEPAAGNVLVLKKPGYDKGEKTSPAVGRADTHLADGYLSLDYRHEGFYGTYPLILRPLSEISCQRPANARFWFNIEVRGHTQTFPSQISTDLTPGPSPERRGVGKNEVLCFLVQPVFRFSPLLPGEGMQGVRSGALSTILRYFHLLRTVHLCPRKFVTFLSGLSTGGGDQYGFIRKFVIVPFQGTKIHD